MGNNAKGQARVGLRPFSEVLIELSGGDVEKRLTRDLAELVRRVEETKGKGKITLTIDVAQGPKVMHVACKVESKLPTEPLEQTAMYTDDKGGLHFENPRQTTMFSGPKVVDASDDDGGAS